jgi:molybdopterin-binding protein
MAYQRQDYRSEERQTITASITNESAEELQLATGKTPYAIIKASSVMVGVD